MLTLASGAAFEARGDSPQPLTLIPNPDPNPKPNLSSHPNLGSHPNPSPKPYPTPNPTQERVESVLPPDSIKLGCDA